jgi:hypothetical protein
MILLSQASFPLVKFKISEKAKDKGQVLTDLVTHLYSPI